MKHQHARKRTAVALHRGGKGRRQDCVSGVRAVAGGGDAISLSMFKKRLFLNKTYYTGYNFE